MALFQMRNKYRVRGIRREVEERSVFEKAGKVKQQARRGVCKLMEELLQCSQRHRQHKPGLELPSKLAHRRQRLDLAHSASHGQPLSGLASCGYWLLCQLAGWTIYACSGLPNPCYVGCFDRAADAKAVGPYRGDGEPGAGIVERDANDDDCSHAEGEGWKAGPAESVQDAIAELRGVQHGDTQLVQGMAEAEAGVARNGIQGTRCLLDNKF
jgi:hypothetical protein